LVYGSKGVGEVFLNWNGFEVCFFKQKSHCPDFPTTTKWLDSKHADDILSVYLFFKKTEK